jgi:aspartate/methionine/tyrosine aminotransferase
MRAKRLAGLGPSPIRVVSDGAKPGTIPLGLGEPGWDMPEVARRALAEVRGQVSYGPNAGIPELREAVAAFHGARENDVVVTVGSQDALFSLLHAWVDPGDEVLVPDPGFPAYPALTRLCGGTPVPYPLDAADRFRLASGPIVAALASRAMVKAVVINHPSNPTGGGASEQTLREIAAACEARDVLLISDEVYRDLWFGERGPSLRDVSVSGVLVSSVSKGFGCPGLRLGWIVGPARWIDPARLVHAYAVTSAAMPSQRAALAMLREAPAVLASSRAECARRFEALADACRRHLGLELEPPDGTFYLWLELPTAVDRSDPVAFAIRVRDEAGVVIIPGTAFGDTGRDWVRISFAAQPELISEGIRRLAPYWTGRA